MKTFSSFERGLYPREIAPPLSAENRELASMDNQARGPADDQKTILVVDDDPTVLNFVSKLLREAGHGILTAGSGAGALALATEHTGPIHLLLSDFEMPGMSGIELASALTLARPQIKVLMMSGFTGGMLVLNEGWHFLAKPFVPTQLRSLVAGLLFPERSRFRP